MRLGPKDIGELYGPAAVVKLVVYPSSSLVGDLFTQPVVCPHGLYGLRKQRRIFRLDDIAGLSVLENLRDGGHRGG